MSIQQLSCVGVYLTEYRVLVCHSTISLATLDTVHSLALFSDANKYNSIYLAVVILEQYCLLAAHAL